MHFPCLKSTVNTNYNSNLSNNSKSNSLNNNNSDLNGNRVLAFKDCINHLARQWEIMDAKYVPLEHRRYNIPSTIINSRSPNRCRNDGRNYDIFPSMSSVCSTTTCTSIYCFLCGLHSDLTLARILYASKESYNLESTSLSISPRKTSITS